MKMDSIGRPPYIPNRTFSSWLETFLESYFRPQLLPALLILGEHPRSQISQRLRIVHAICRFRASLLPSLFDPEEMFSLLRHAPYKIRTRGTTGCSFGGTWPADSFPILESGEGMVCNASCNLAFPLQSSLCDSCQPLLRISQTSLCPAMTCKLYPRWLPGRPGQLLLAALRLQCQQKVGCQHYKRLFVFQCNLRLFSVAFLMITSHGNNYCLAFSAGLAKTSKSVSIP